VIVFLSSPWRTAALTVAVLVIAVWVIDGHHLPHLHLPTGVLSVLAAPLLAALMFIVATAEAERLANRRRAGGERR
jgi:hypothetical protein